MKDKRERDINWIRNILYRLEMIRRYGTVLVGRIYEQYIEGKKVTPSKEKKKIAQQVGNNLARLRGDLLELYSALEKVKDRTLTFDWDKIAPSLLYNEETLGRVAKPIKDGLDTLDPNRQLLFGNQESFSSYFFTYIELPLRAVINALKGAKKPSAAWLDQILIRLENIRKFIGILEAKLWENYISGEEQPMEEGKKGIAKEVVGQLAIFGRAVVGLIMALHKELDKLQEGEDEIDWDSVAENLVLIEAISGMDYKDFVESVAVKLGRLSSEDQSIFGYEASFGGFFVGNMAFPFSEVVEEIIQKIEEDRGLVREEKAVEVSAPERKGEGRNLEEVLDEIRDEICRLVDEKEIWDEEKRESFKESIKGTIEDFKQAIRENNLREIYRNALTLNRLLLFLPPSVHSELADIFAMYDETLREKYPDLFRQGIVLAKFGLLSYFLQSLLAR